VGSAVPQTLPAEFAEPLRRVAEQTRSFVTRTVWYPEITSTNDVAAAFADAGAEQGLIVMADTQTAGRGRLGRSWASPSGAGIYASVILRPERPVAELLTIAAGVAIADGIEAATGLAPRLKWPNDVVIHDRTGGAGGRKVAGILAESGVSSGGSRWVVLGFGINVLPAAYPSEIAARATSLENELGRAIDRGLVLAECVSALAARYSELCAGRGQSIVSAWRLRGASMLGRQVEWESGGMLHSGVACDIDERGALIVSDGTDRIRMTSGEIRWV
jgi:BirA family biotin operon repressor/biotin-[acetyl-CoA-carboxylase] ligase